MSLLLSTSGRRHPIPKYLRRLGCVLAAFPDRVRCPLPSESPCPPIDLRCLGNIPQHAASQYRAATRAAFRPGDDCATPAWCAGGDDQSAVVFVFVFPGFKAFPDRECGDDEGGGGIGPPPAQAG